MGPEARRRLRRARGLTAAPTTVHLLRHAAHGLLPHTLAGRMAGVGLSAEGRSQAAALGARFRDVPLAAVVTSPVRRAAETAAAIRPAPERDPGWTEIDFGSWTGRRFDDLAADPGWRRWNRLRAFAAPPGGEAMHAAQSRALAALERLRLAHPGAALAVVSHADIIKAVLAPALGFGLGDLHRMVVDPASVSTIVLFDDDVRVEAVNRSA